MSESLVVLTWGPKETPTSFSDIFVGSEDITVIFYIIAKDEDTHYYVVSFFYF